MSQRIINTMHVESPNSMMNIITMPNSMNKTVGSFIGSIDQFGPFA